MARLWRCPHCGSENPLSEPLQLLHEARKHDAIVVANVARRGIPCPRCTRTVDIETLARGDHDLAGAGAASTIDYEPGAPCLYCGGEPSGSSAATVHLWKESVAGTHSVYVKIPRCARCAAGHGRSSDIAAKIGITGGALMAALVLFRFATTGTDFSGKPVGFFGTLVPAIFLGFLAGIVSFFLGGLAGRLFTPGVRAESIKFGDERVRAVESRGYSIDKAS